MRRFHLLTLAFLGIFSLCLLAIIMLSSPTSADPVMGWSDEFQIDDQASSVSHQKVAMDDKGSAVVVWQQNLGGVSCIFGRAYSSDNGWGPTTFLGDYIGQREGTPIVKMDRTGNAIVVWFRQDGSTTAAICNEYIHDSGWLCPTSVANNPYDLDLSMDPAGEVSLVYSKFDFSNSHFYIYSKTYNINDGWSGDVKIYEYSQGDIFSPRISSSSPDSKYLVWIESWTDNGWQFRRVCSAKHTNEIGWALLGTIGGGGNPFQVTLSTNINDAALATWCQVIYGWDNGNFIQEFAAIFHDGHWTEPVAISNQVHSIDKSSSAMDALGNAILIWAESSDSGSDLVWARFDNQTGWSPPQVMDDNFPGLTPYPWQGGSEIGAAYEPTIIMSSSGTALTSWHYLSKLGPNYERYYSVATNRFVPGKGWRGDDYIGLCDGSENPVAIDLNKNGEAIISWVSEGHLYARLYSISIGAPSIPLLFQAYPGDAQAEMSWEPPLDDGGANVTNYKIYLLRDSEFTLLGQVQYQINNYIDEGLENGREYSYRIAAVNEFGEGKTSYSVTVIPSRVPSSPENVSAILNLPWSKRMVSWDEPIDTGGGVLGYRVFKGSSPSDMQLIFETDGKAYTDSDSSSGLVYYEIRAFNFKGEGTPSQMVNCSMLSGQVPSIPLNLSAQNLDDCVKLSWNSPLDMGSSPIRDYYVFRGWGDYFYLGHTRFLFRCW
jgi:hypothetical protein